MEGYLWKTDRQARHWRRRYFVLEDFELGYKKTKGTKNYKDKLEVEMLDVFATADPSMALKQRTEFGFRLKDMNSGRIYHLCAARHHEKTQWMQKLKQTLGVLNKIKHEDDGGGSDLDGEGYDEYDDGEGDSDYPDYDSNINSFQQLGGDGGERADVCFFLKVMGGAPGEERRFEVAIPEEEAEQLTVGEIKEQFSDTLQAAPAEISMSIDGETLRDDFKGYEFGLHNGAVIEVRTLRARKAEPQLPSQGGRFSSPSNFFASPNSDDVAPKLGTEEKVEASTPPASQDDGRTAEIDFQATEEAIKEAEAALGQPPPPPPMPPAETGGEGQARGQAAEPIPPEDDVIEYAKRPVPRVGNASGGHTFTVLPGEDVHIAVKEICISQGIDYEEVGPALIAHLEEMRAVKPPEPRVNVAGLGPREPAPVAAGPTGRERKLDARCKQLEAALEQKEQYQNAYMKRLAGNSENVEARLMEEVKFREEKIRENDAEHRRYINELKGKHRNEMERLEEMVNVLNKKVMEMQGQAVFPKAPRDEVIMGLEEQVEQLKKRLKAARTLSAFEEGAVDSAYGTSPQSVPLERGVSQLSSTRDPALSRGQWRQFMDEKRLLIARANRDKERLMNENRALREQLLREQGFQQRQLGGY
jgi:hypothetical protein